MEALKSDVMTVESSVQHGQIHLKIRAENQEEVVLLQLFKKELDDNASLAVVNSFTFGEGIGVLGIEGIPREDLRSYLERPAHKIAER